MLGLNNVIKSKELNASAKRTLFTCISEGCKYEVEGK